MYCENCGAQNYDDATRCTNCGNVLQPIQTPGYDVPTPPQFQEQAPIPNYLVPAILTTLFCCLPAGVISIVYAAQINGKVAAGDRVGALERSQKARSWAMISFGLGLTVIVLFVLFVGCSAVIGSSG